MGQCIRNPEVKKSFNKQASVVRNLLKPHRGNLWVNFLGPIDHLVVGWSKIYNFNKRLHKNPPPEHSLLDGQGTLEYDASSKAEIFVGKSEEQFQTPSYSI